MKIGILETGLIREELASRFPAYPVMFERLVDLSGDPFSYDVTSVVRGDQLPAIDACDGWLITGSRFGVYDNEAWMPPLQAFIRALADAGKPLIGVCFGHQIVAEALGGKVVKSDRGWGVGVHRYRVDRRPDWLTDDQADIGIYAFHQDQVVSPPEGADIFLSSDFCPYAGLTYGDSIISVQAHPEFREDYEVALLETYGGSVVPAAVAAAALEDMRAGAVAETQRLGDWFGEFYRRHR